MKKRYLIRHIGWNMYLTSKPLAGRHWVINPVNAEQFTTYEAAEETLATSSLCGEGMYQIVQTTIKPKP